MCAAEMPEPWAYDWSEDPLGLGPAPDAPGPQIESQTFISESPLDVAARMWEQKHSPKPRRFPAPGDLARHITAKTITTPALDLIDTALTNLGPNERIIITMPPQEGKSTRVSHDYVLWRLEQDPELRIACASYAQALATRNGRKVRNTIAANPDLGIKIAADNGSAGEWTIEGHRGGLFSVGVGGGFSGLPVDILIIDDPVANQQEADSPTERENVWQWWLTVASARFGADTPVVLVMTRWHDDDLAGRLLAEEDSDWTVLNIPAQADHNPLTGETDVLGREPGEFMVSARGRTLKQWLQRKKTAGRRAWQALYQGNPSPAGGIVFNPEDLRFWTRYPSRATEGPEGVMYLSEDEIERMKQTESWDLTFTGDKGSDWVAGQRWASRGSLRFLLAQRRGKWEFPDQIVQMTEFSTESAKTVTTRLVEKAANGAAALATLRGKIGGLKAIKPTESKEARAVACSPQVEAHDVYFPLPTDPGNEWVLDVIEEMRQFPTGKHDDTVDAMSQYLNHARGRGDNVVNMPSSVWERQVWQQ